MAQRITLIAAGLLLLACSSSDDDNGSIEEHRAGQRATAAINKGLAEAASQAKAQDEIFVTVARAAAKQLPKASDAACPVPPTSYQIAGTENAFRASILGNDPATPWSHEVAADAEKVRERIVPNEKPAPAVIADAKTVRAQGTHAIALVTRSYEEPALVGESSFRPGKFVGTALLVDVGTKRVVCIAEVEASNSDEVKTWSFGKKNQTRDMINLFGDFQRNIAKTASASFRAVAPTSGAE